MISTKHLAVLSACLGWAPGILSAQVSPVTISTTSVDVFLTSSVAKVTLTLEGVTGPPIDGEMPLKPGDVIQTGPNSRAEISFEGKTLVRLMPSSAIRLVRLDPQSIVLYLRRGVVMAKVNFEKKSGEHFSVVSPAATASVTGTEFVVDHAGTLSRIGVLDEGHVLVKSAGFKKRVILHFNQETEVTKGFAPADAHVLQRLYPHKIQMAIVRQHLKGVRKNPTNLTPEQKDMMRAGWVKTNTPVKTPSKPPRKAPKKTNPS